MELTDSMHGSCSQKRANRAWLTWGIPLLLGLFTFGQGLFYLAIIPPWQTPDEPRHYEYVRLLHDKGRLVSWADITPSVEKEIIASLDQFDFWKWGASEYRGQRPSPLPDDFAQIWGEGSHELHQPPLSYLLYLVPLSLLADKPIVIQLYGMRFVSVLLNVVIVLAAYVTGRELFSDDQRLALSIPIFIMLLPQHSFQASGVNGDHLAEAAISWMFPLLVRTFKHGISILRLANLAALVVVSLAAKRTGLVSLPILFFAFSLYAFQRVRRQHWSARKLATAFAGAGLALGLTALVAISGWQWITRHAPGIASWVWQIYLFLPSQQFPFTLDARVISPEAIAFYFNYVKMMFISTWGHYGWMNISLGVHAYWFFAALCSLAFLGLARFSYRAVASRSLLNHQQSLLLLFAASIAIAFVLVIANEVRRWDLKWGGDPQARYLFPVLIPLATLFLVGTRDLFPKRFHRLWFALVVGGMILFNAIALFGYILPFYHA